MYAYIKGKLIQKKPANIIIETAGIGYDILVSMNTYSNLPSQDEETSLLLHFIPREDSHNLYGFYTQDEKDLFLKLKSFQTLVYNTFKKKIRFFENLIK